MSDNDLWEHAYDDDNLSPTANGQSRTNNHALVVFAWDGKTAKLMLKVKQAPGIKESATIGISRKGRTYTFHMSLGDEEYDEDLLPDPIRQYCAQVTGAGQGRNLFDVALPPMNRVLDGYRVRPYSQYLGKFYMEAATRRDKPLPKKLYLELGKWYLAWKGVPLYL